MLSLPGDKSISHRRALFTLLTDEEVRIANYGSGDDCATSLTCLSEMGKRVKRNGNEVLIGGTADNKRVRLDCGNSGTTARLLMGLLAGCDGKFELVGDESLSRRPMNRVAEPLRRMGAQIELTDGHLPARITGADLTGIRYEAPVASAQVKSAVLLAGLRATGETYYREPAPSRDHTERLLEIAPDPEGWLCAHGGVAFPAARLRGEVPGDPSSAAFWICAANLIPDSKIRLHGVLANRGRNQYVSMLRVCGAGITATAPRKQGGEDVCDLHVQQATLTPLGIENANASQVIDEIPVLSVLAATLAGRSEFHDVGELRVKESDRLALIVENLRAMGADVRDWSDGFAVIGGGRLHGARIRAAGDHRIAMAFAVAGLWATGETIIDDAHCVSVSYPEFWEHMRALVPGSVRINE